jgi:hypothetical protein
LYASLETQVKVHMLFQGPWITSDMPAAAAAFLYHDKKSGLTRAKKGPCAQCGKTV